MPRYPDAVTEHLRRPVGVGPLDTPDTTGESGSAHCGDLVRMELRISGGYVRDAAFLAFGCPAVMAAASCACARLRGATLADAMRLSVADIETDLGGLADEHRHGPDLVIDALARALEAWYSARLGGYGLPRRGNRVAVAMSGGVDSAVAAMLLVRQGYDVIGVTMRLWHDPLAAAAERSCCSPETVRLARASAHHLGIPHLTLDVAETFRREVVEAFIRGYQAGETPNPCVTCNGSVRFRVLDQAAALVGARRLASGHYVQVEKGVLARAADQAKDQSYMLANLPRDLAGRLDFPLGQLTKDTVRGLAAEAALPCAASVESQDVCFVGEGGYVPFLERHGDLDERPGPIRDQSGVQVGTHQGYWRYTVGQRKGLRVDGSDARYVLSVDAAANTVVVGGREDLATNTLRLSPASIFAPLTSGDLEVRVRYRGASLRGVAFEDPDGGLRVALTDPADGVAPGQTAALYHNDRLVAAGTITAPHNPEREG